MTPFISSKRDAIDDGVPNPRGEINAILSIAFACLSFILVSLRLLVRCLVNKLAGPDDYLIVGSLWFFAAQLIYKVATCLTKLSILSLYLRIFPNRNFRISTWIIGAIVVAYTLAACLVTVFGCHPIYKAWDKKAEGKCVDIIQVWYSTSIMIIITDVMIILLPLNQIRHLQLPLFRKVLLSGVFTQDQIYYQATSNSWTFLEVNVGIICACLPVLRMPIRKLLSPLRSKKTTVTGSRTHDHQLRTIGRMTSRGTTKNKTQHDDDSYEELIVQANGSQKLSNFNRV
ncbi:uncharacterized protein LA080_001044 [Diaporthe eres]|nr:uncharacterized protein LA080_001044 [Diaporthe eres]